MKHAYLIIAHNEFEVLRCLLTALDDERNDVFVHIDKKVSSLPSLSMEKSGLYIMDERYDVRWGHTSQLDAEFVLFSAAWSKGGYSFYHLISGVHLPLYSQDYIHSFFENQPDSNFFAKMPTSGREVELKLRRYHFFIRNFIHTNSLVQKTDQFIWHVLIKWQDLFRISRYKNLSFEKASQWVSLNKQAVHYLVENAKKIKNRYKWTFCPDEFFILSSLNQSSLKDTVVDCPQLLRCEFTGVSPKVWTSSDFTSLMDSGCLFARKFNSKNMKVVHEILETIKNRK